MADILNIAVSALNVYQRALNVTGHNVANVNTEGYSRQRIEPQAREPEFLKGSYFGSGVTSSAVSRAYDEFLQSQVRASLSATGNMESYYKIASQIERVIADADAGLDPAVQDFFDAMQGLSDDPASTPVRELLLSESQSLVDRFHFLDRTLDAAKEQVHTDMQSAVEEINSLAESIAELNLRIASTPGIHQGAWPNDLLDQRDQAINELSRFVNINTLPQDDGTITVFFGKGQPMVLGLEASRLAVVDSPIVPNHKDIAYIGQNTVNIVSEQISGGELEGLLRARDEILEQGRNSLGLVAMGISFEVNAQHREGINLMDQTGLDFFTDISLSQSRASTLNAPASDYLFDIQVTDPGKLPAADFVLTYNGGGATDFTNYTLENENEGTILSPAVPLPGFPWDFSADLGIEINLSSGVGISAGDRFFFSPTAEAASRIGLQLRDAQAIAAASPVEVNPAGANTGNGAVSLPSLERPSTLPISLAAPVTLTFNPDLDGIPATNDPGFNVVGATPATLAYDPVTQGDGQTFRLSVSGFELVFTVTGQPAGGDVFTFDNGSAARPGDNRNALLMADLQSWQGMLDGNAGFQDTFGNYVAEIGASTRQANVNMEAQQRMLELNKDSLASVVGVNLDEEAANLIRFQQAYQAAAQVISTASTLFDSLISAVR